jgi:GTPase SAR1 family protein
MYDVSDRRTFIGLKEWLGDIKMSAPENVVLAIVGNKIDLMNHQVNVNEAQQFAATYNALFKLTSAKENRGID